MVRVEREEARLGQDHIIAALRLRASSRRASCVGFDQSLLAAT
jgi:hypothetical protein